MLGRSYKPIVSLLELGDDELMDLMQVHTQAQAQAQAQVQVQVQYTTIVCTW
jgi:hypothetical protein